MTHKYIKYTPTITSFFRNFKHQAFVPCNSTSMLKNCNISDLLDFFPSYWLSKTKVVEYYYSQVSSWGKFSVCCVFLPKIHFIHKVVNCRLMGSLWNWCIWLCNSIIHHNYLLSFGILRDIWENSYLRTLWFGSFNRNIS